MRRGVVAITFLLVTALVPMPTAHAAACDSILFDGNAYISGSNSTEFMYVRHNSVSGNIECRLGGVGAYGIVGAKASIGRIDINLGGSADELHLGDTDFPTEDLSGTPVFAVSPFDGDLLFIDAGNSPLAHNLSVTSEFLQSTTTTGTFQVRFSGFVNAFVSTGHAVDTVGVQFPLSVLTVFADGGAGSNLIRFQGSFGNDRLKSTDGRVEWNDTHGVNHSNFDVIELHGGSGKDRISGGPQPEELHGGDGNDRLVGGGGRDSLFGEGGRDTCIGGPGKDSFKGCEKKRQ